MSDEKKQQVLALGRLGWSLRKIEERLAFGARRPVRICARREWPYVHHDR